MNLTQAFENYNEQLAALQLRYPELYELVCSYVPKYQAIGFIQKLTALVVIAEGERALP